MLRCMGPKIPTTRLYPIAYTHGKPDTTAHKPGQTSKNTGWKLGYEVSESRMFHRSSDWKQQLIRDMTRIPPNELIKGNNPVFRLAKTMLEETLAALPRVKGNEFLIGSVSVDEEDYELCFVRLEGNHNPQRIRFYGHNARQLASQQQEFLVVSRQLHMDDAQKVYNALLLIDWNVDVATRIGVASLRSET
ncbi:hypothetical protein JVT61DRAFT_716 [Boletus reticuloceps]|uniref:Uncharacterized protein n=1 Tax=Boletus reticuloceps TaxID=495285 RepID=A0A8I2Z383_9AGAM|nr:hypothetical protein JVT61DRAFT_716 [Boletus reticuloceps]